MLKKRVFGAVKGISVCELIKESGVGGFKTERYEAFEDGCQLLFDKGGDLRRAGLFRNAFKDFKNGLEALWVLLCHCPLNGLVDLIDVGWMGCDLSADLFHFSHCCYKERQSKNHSHLRALITTSFYLAGRRGFYPI